MSNQEEQIQQAQLLLEKTIEVLQEQQPSVGALLLYVSNLVYSIGASIGQWGDKGPNFEELEKLGYENPGKIDIALMRQAMLMSTWYSDLHNLNKETES